MTDTKRCPVNRINHIASDMTYFLEIPNNVEPCVQGYQFNYIPLGKNFGFTPRIPINFYEK